jgi:hypothetical protein
VELELLGQVDLAHPAPSKQPLEPVAGRRGADRFAADASILRLLPRGKSRRRDPGREAEEGAEAGRLSGMSSNTDTCLARRSRLRGLATPARVAAVLGLAALGLLASSTAVAQPTRASIALTIDQPTVSGKWRQGWFGLAFSPRKGSLLVTRRATLTVRGTVDTATRLSAVVRPLDRVAPAIAHQTFNAGPGNYSAALTLPIRPLPGKYRVTVGVLTVNNATVSKDTRDVVFKAPPEGVVSSAEISATKHGPAVTVLRSRHQAFARFRFLAPPPRARKVTIQWRTPNNKLICQTADLKILPNCELPLKYNQTVYTYLRSPVKDLTRGNWYCELSVDGRLARRAFVRLR